MSKCINFQNLAMRKGLKEKRFNVKGKPNNSQPVIFLSELTMDNYAGS